MQCEVEVTRLKEAFAILKYEYPAVGEVWLLGHHGAAALHGVLVELAAALDFGVVLALQVVAEGGGHAGAAPRLQRVEDQDARPEKERPELSLLLQSKNVKSHRDDVI